MTVSSRVSSIIYIGDESTTNFDVPFRFLEDSDLQLSIQSTDGTVTNLVLNSDYTVTGANADNGGKVHLTHPVGNQAKLSILRVVDLLQETDYRENERFPAESHERALDKLTMEVQQLQEQSDRAIKIGVFSDADPSEIVYEIEELYDIKDSIITTANISSDIVTCSNNIDAIKDAPNQANAAMNFKTEAENNANDARNSKIEAQNSAVTAQLMAAQAQEWATKTDGKVDGTEYSSKYYAGQASDSAQQAAISAAGTHFKLFQHQWFDYELNDLAWLRADTFSWQSGTVYTNAYNHLVDDIDGITHATETVGGQTVTFYRASDGHKIVLADQETTVNNIYTATGVAWYYILDTANNRFKLPRTKYDFNGLRGNVGDYIPESLPNITGSATGWNDSDSQRTDFGIIGGKVTGAFTRRAGYRNGAVTPTNITADNSASSTMLGFDASNSSSTYQDNAPVQQRCTQQYLYFYVGQYTQSAIEQTAGLNAELFNNKIDIDGNNVITAGANKILNTSSYTTNRILEIPQDIKLELNNGTLTLKAGSKTCKADGIVVTVPSDINYYYTGTTVDNLILVYDSPINGMGVYIQGVNAISSATAPSTGVADTLWFDTTSNKCKITHDNAATWTEIPLPIGLVSCNTTDGFTSINQVFNGFGYIGSTVFALPGVKYEFPNGFNEDGSYKSTFYTSNKVSVLTIIASGSHSLGLIMFDNGSISYAGFLEYNPKTNYNRYDETTDYLGGIFGRVYTIDTKVQRAVFRQVDSVANSNASNFSQAGRSYLSGLGIETTTGAYLVTKTAASETDYIAPTNGVFKLNCKTTATGRGYCQMYNTTQYTKTSGTLFMQEGQYFNAASSGDYFRAVMKVKKGDTIRIQYSSNCTINVNECGLFFFPLEGEV